MARLARLSNGLLNRQHISRSGRVHEFRTAGATGARYPLELYFMCDDLPDLPGVFHYTTNDHGLRQLRTGDLRGAIVATSGSEPSLSEAPVILVMTTTFWRNAWRYKARAYRHTFCDTAPLLANFLAMAASLELATQVANAALWCFPAGSAQMGRTSRGRF